LEGVAPECTRHKLHHLALKFKRPFAPYRLASGCMKRNNGALHKGMKTENIKYFQNAALFNLPTKSATGAHYQ